MVSTYANAEARGDLGVRKMGQLAGTTFTENNPDLRQYQAARLLARFEITPTRARVLADLAFSNGGDHAH